MKINSRIIIAFLLLLFSYACALNQTVLSSSNSSNEKISQLSMSEVVIPPLSMSEVVIPPDYSTEKGKLLATKHAEGIKNIFNNIRKQYDYEELEFSPITKMQDGRITSGIGFFKEDVKGKDEDNSYLGISVGTNYIFKQKTADENNNGEHKIYIKYIRNLLHILTDEGIIMSDKDVDGVSIRISWFLTKYHGFSNDVVGLLIRSSKEDANDYVYRNITTQEFLEKSESVIFGENISTQTVKLNITSLSEDSDVFAQPQYDSSIIDALHQFDEVKFLDFDDTFMQFDYGDLGGLYIPVDKFDIKGFLKPLFNQHQMKLDIKNMKEEIQKNRMWVKSMYAKIRFHNSVDTYVMDQLEKGSSVFIQDQKEGWYHVYYGEPSDDMNFESVSKLFSHYKSGWVLKSDISDSYIRKATIADKRRWKFIEDNSNIDYKFLKAIQEGKMELDMTKEMVIAICGNPKDIKRTVKTTGVHEQWIYGGGVYLYLENGILTSWQDYVPIF
jgi:hypothetical protein